MADNVPFELVTETRVAVRRPDRLWAEVRSKQVYYVKVDQGYKVVPAPAGAKVTTLPENSVQVTVDSEPYYYYGGAFYKAIPGQYEVVAAPVGAVVSSLPDGTNTVVKSEETYFRVWRDVL